MTASPTERRTVAVFSAARLRALRKERGLSQLRLAARMPGPEPGSQVTISQLEQGARQPSARMVAKLAAALQCELSELFSEAEAPDVVA
jgi:transcriptional regulator with XRE-family HTH domain